MEKLAKLLLKCFLVFLMSSFVPPHKENKSEDYEVYVNEIVNTFSKEMKKEFGLICIGSGGRMPKNVKQIDVLFITYRKATVEEARVLEVKATEKLLQAINSHQKIRPFLEEYPFQANRARISIAFREPDNSCRTDGSVVYAFQVKNKIYYQAEESITEKRIMLAEEPYEEALKIVKGKDGINLVPSKIIL